MIRPCPSCGQKNRVPPDHLNDSGRCGSCKAELPAVDAPLEVDAATFDEIVSKAKVPILVDFWAAWCAPCRMAAPEVKKVAELAAGRALVLKVDTEAEPGLAARYNVRGIPNFAVFKNGQLVNQNAGFVNHQRMLSWLEKAG